MNATKMSQTVPSWKPDRAHLIVSADFGVTRSATVAIVTPTRPTAAAGIGSRISAITTAANNEKYCHAAGESPAGTGRQSKTAPAVMGAAAFQYLVNLPSAVLMQCVRTVSAVSTFGWVRNLRFI